MCEMTGAKNMVTEGARFLGVVGLVTLLCGTAGAVMDTAGQFAVGDVGSAKYDIPIQLPPGVSGVAPQLAVSYNSQGANGILGVGWTLSGFSEISRCPRTKYQDGTKGSVLLDANDRFCLDGQRLILVSGTYGANGAEYRTELDSFSKIISYGVAGAGPAWFKVWTKSGSVIEYGNTTDSRIEAQGKDTVRVWAMNRNTDTKGNYFSLTYLEDSPNGVHYPKQIDYTGNVVAGTIPSSSVRFVYESRPDVIQGAFLGVVAKTTQRLKAIEVLQNAAVQREYRFSYEVGTTTSRSRLVKAMECHIASAQCKSPVQFTWSESSYQLGAPSTWGSTAPHYFSDMNGDGKADFIMLKSDGVYVALSTGSGIGELKKWKDEFGSSHGFADSNVNPVFFEDINGDGRPDAIGIGSNGVYAAHSSGFSLGYYSARSWDFAPDKGWTTMESFPRMFADINGDGFPDLVGFKNDGVYVQLNSGDGAFGNTAQKRLSDFGTETTIKYTSNSANPRYAVDVNGDGFADFVGFANNAVYVALGNATGHAAATSWSTDFTVNAGWTTQDKFPRMFTDVNGDGLLDIVGFKNDGVYVGINTGTAFLAATKWISDFGTATSTAYATQKGFPRYLIDVNGDGYADIVGFSSAGVQVSLSKGTEFSPAVQWIAGFGSAAGYGVSDQRSFADMDGDGFIDILGVKSSGVAVALSGRTIPPDYLLSVTSGHGLQTTVEYKPLTNAAVYTRGATAVSPLVDIMPPMYVVSVVNKPNALGSGKIATSYRYANLVAELKGRGMLGFGMVEEAEAATNVVKRTYYDQDWPYTGFPLREMVYLSGSPGYLSMKTNSYACIKPQVGGACAIAAGNRYFPYLSKSVETSWDLNGAFLSEKTITNTYDAFGNPTRIIVALNDGNSVTTTNTYTNDVTNWFLGRLTKTTVASSVGGAATAPKGGVFNFNATISSNATNYNVKTKATSAGWDGVSILNANITINAGVTVSATATTTAAFSTGVDLSPGSTITLVNNGMIVGKGGAGGGGAIVTTSQFGDKLGQAGGAALRADWPITITNNGTLAGGGGGGSTGGSYKIEVCQTGTNCNKLWAHAAGSGGGGGAGGGLGGAAGNASGGGYNVSGLKGNPGTMDTPGTGGATVAAWNFPSLIANAGGAGGGLGEPGKPGLAVYGTSGIGPNKLYKSTSWPGGDAGASVSGSGNVTWINQGTLKGPLQ